MSDDKTLFFAHDVSAASVVSLLIQTSKAPKVAAAVAADAADVAETAAAEAEAASLPEGTVELSFRFSGGHFSSAGGLRAASVRLPMCACHCFGHQIVNPSVLLVSPPLFPPFFRG